MGINLLAKVLLGTSALAGTAIPFSAYAQSASENNASDIVVTARRVEERLQDVPISISVFSQEQITERNVVNSQDLAAYTPSLAANTNFGSENSTYAIRGFVQDIGTPPSVGVYFADVVAPRGPTAGIVAGDGAGPGYFFDLQNVQVLKGPQGTLFGRNTTGGAVLFVPHKPTHRFEGYVEGSLGNYDLRRIEGAINVPLGETARLRIAADHQERDGYLRNSLDIGADRFSDVNYTAIRATFEADLSAEVQNSIIASYTSSKTNGFVQKIVGCNPATLFGGQFACPQIARAAARGDGFWDISSNIREPRSNLEQWQIINTTTWQVSDSVTLKNIASYSQFKQDVRTALFGVDWTVNNQSLPFVYIQSAPGMNASEQETFTEEFRVQGSTLDSQLTYQVGAYLEVSNPLALAGTQTPTLISCTDLNATQCTDFLGIGFTQAAGGAFPIRVGSVTRTTFRTSFRDVGLYAQATYTLTETLKLTGGFRYTWDRQKSQTTRTTFEFPVIPPIITTTGTERCSDASAAPSCTVAAKAKSSAPTWLIDLDYKPVDDVLIYAKYARGYRAGGVFLNSPLNYRLFRPEKVDNFEVGIKAAFDGTVRGRFNVAAFYNNFTNQQLQVGFTPAPGRLVPQTTGIVNAGRSRIYGVEADFSITPFENFTIDGGYTYLNATIRKIDPLVSTDPNYVVSAQINAGDPLVLSPKHKLVGSARYTVPLGDAVGDVTFGATVTHVSSQLTSYVYKNPVLLAAFGSNFGLLPSRTLLNLNASWKAIAGLPIDLSAFATNVTNKKYYSFVPGLANSGFESAIVGEPRMYGARMRYTF